MSLLSACIGIACISSPPSRANLIAALPTRIQQNIDRRTLSKFAQSHEKISSSVQIIDPIKHTIIFGNAGECVAHFERDKRTFPVIGPIPQLVFSESNCDFGFNNSKEVKSEAKKTLFDLSPCPKLDHQVDSRVLSEFLGHNENH